MNITKWLSRIINRISLIGKIRHIYSIKIAKKVLRKIIEIEKQEYGHQRALLYLRKINPYVFEELILTAIENSNIRVIRNKSYSGDGGLDGTFKIKKGFVLVQAKRYKSYINNEHVKDFSNIVKKEKFFFGVFVHTGKTGEKSKQIRDIEKNIIFISGSVLINLIVGKLNIEKLINEKDSHK